MKVQLRIILDDGVCLVDSEFDGLHHLRYQLPAPLILPTETGKVLFNGFLYTPNVQRLDEKGE